MAMKSTTIAVWFGFLATCAARFLEAAHKPLQVDTVHQEGLQKPASALTVHGQAKPPLDQIASLKEQVAELQKEKTGLVLTVRRLLKANQTEAQKKTLSALRGAEKKAQEMERKLKSVESVDAAEILKLHKLEKETERKLNREEEAFDSVALKEDNKGKAERAKLETQVKKLTAQKAGLEDEKRGLEATVQKLWHVNATAEADSILKVLAQKQHALEASESDKQALSERVRLFSLENAQLHKVNEDLEEDKQERGTKEARLRRNSDEADRQLKEKTSQLEQTKKSLEEKTKADGKAEQLLKKKAAEAEKELVFLRQEKITLEDQLSKAQEALTYSVDKENSDSQILEKLKAEKEKLAEAAAAAAKKQKDVETQLSQMTAHDRDLKAMNLNLLTKEKNERDQVQRVQKQFSEAEKRKQEMQDKLEFAVDQQNTEMMAVKMLKSENSKLKDSLKSQVQIQAALKKANENDEAKASAIKNLTVQKFQAEDKVRSLIAQVATLKHQNVEFEDQYIRARAKLNSIADEDTTEHLALEVLRGDNRKLQEQLMKVSESEAEMEEVAKASKSKADALDASEAENYRLKKELKALRQSGESLQRKNDELKETVVEVAAKSRDYAAPRFRAAATDNPAASDTQQPVQVPAAPSGGLEKASMELSKLAAQLNEKQQKQDEAKHEESSILESLQ